MSKPPTPQGISRLLAKAGFKKAESRRVGRFHEMSEGFITHAAGDDRSAGVIIAHARGFAFGDEIRTLRDQAFSRYTETLLDAGFSVRPQGDRLIVTAGEGE
jgi:hypothetical protein